MNTILLAIALTAQLPAGNLPWNNEAERLRWSHAIRIERALQAATARRRRLEDRRDYGARVTYVFIPRLPGYTVEVPPGYTVRQTR